MSKSKDKWTNEDLVWDKALGAYVPRGKEIATPAAGGSRYKDPMNGDFDPIDPIDPNSDIEGGLSAAEARMLEEYDEREARKQMDADWEAFARQTGQSDLGEVLGGDSLDDFAAINHAATQSNAHSKVALSWVSDCLQRGLCPKCVKTGIKRKLAENGDVVATCATCHSDFVDESYSPSRFAPKPASGATLSDLAAGRYGTHKPAKGGQGDLFKGYGDGSWSSRSGGYGSGSGYGGFGGGSGGSYNSLGFNLPPKPVQTSKSHPIRVDFLDSKVLARSGRLGMTFAPGKVYPGMSADHVRDLDEDLKTLCQIGANTLVCLIEDHEFDLLKIPDLLEKAQNVGIDTIWHPIKDFGVPHDTEAFLDLLNAILDDVEAGKTVVVHCRGGIGRSGTVVASTLVALGWAPKEAIKHTRKARHGAVETLSQENYVAWIDACFRVSRVSR